MNIEHKDLLPLVIEIAEEAAAKILKIYSEDIDVQTKDDESPLTLADLASHKVIVEGLSELTPEIPVMSEESADIPYELRKTWSTYWLVDPLDGTKEFIKRNGEFTVNIALIENHQPVLGVVQVPVTGVCYFAAAGLGAFKKEVDKPAQKIKSKSTTPASFIVAGSRSHGSELQQAFFAALGDNTEIVAIGSSLKFCLVAEGKVDIYPRFGLTSEWDTAAAHAIVLESGGFVSRTDLTPLQYNQKDSVLNPHFLVVADRDFDWNSYLKMVNLEQAQ